MSSVLKRPTHLPDRGRIVGLVARQSPDYVARFFAYLRDGMVVVPLRSIDDEYRIDSAGVREVVEPAAGSGWIDSAVEFRSDDALAQIAFTSGTEGNPKGVLLTHRNLTSTVSRIVDAMQIDASIREYVGVPVYHSFGFGRCRVAAAVGGSAFIPDGAFNPKEIAQMLRDDEINAVSAVPSLWRIVLQNAGLFAQCGHKVRWIEIGSQPMTADEKRQMRRLFPDARIVQHYGLTEASRTTFLDVSGSEESLLESVGAPNGDVQLQIAEDGRIRIRGSHVAQTLLVDGQEVSNTDASGWLTTSDLGEIRDGLLYFGGRADDVINCGGIKIAPDRLEHTLNEQLSLMGGIAVSRVPDETRGDGVLVVALEAVDLTDEEILKAAADALSDYGVNAGSSLHLLRLKTLPTTDTGKVKRAELADAFAQSRASRQDGIGETNNLLARLAGRLRRQKPRTVRELYSQQFPGTELNGSETFVRLGGDSLSFVTVSMMLEEMLGQLPDGWQNLTVDELDDIRPDKRWLHPVDTSLFMRFVGIVAVVTGHFTTVPIGGATFLLLIFAGYNFARFQVPNVVDRKSVAPILTTVSRLALPLLLMLAALQIRQQDLQPFEFTLLTNWIPVGQQEFDFWFIEFIVQLFLIVAALFCIPAVRRAARERPQTLAWVTLAISSATAVFAPLLWNTTPLYDRVPHMLMWLFALGWVLQLAKRPLTKLATAAMAIVLPLLVWGPAAEADFWIAQGHYWVAGGCLLTLFAERISVPWPVNKLAFWIGGASMMIYIVHWQVYFNWLRLGILDHPAVNVAVAVVGGIVCWWGWERMTLLAARCFRRFRRTSG